MHRAVRRRVSMLGGLVAMMLVWVVAHQRQLASAAAMMIDAQSQQAQVRELAEKKQTMQDQRERLAANEELLRQLASPTELAVVFADLSSRVREPFVLTRVTVMSPCVSQYARRADEDKVVNINHGNGAPKSADPTPRNQTPSIAIHGIAKSAQDVIMLSAILENSPLFDRVQIITQSASEWAGRRAQKFEMTCDLVPQQRRRS